MQKPSERITVLVTGANGQLGREMRRAAEGSKDRYVFTDVNTIVHQRHIHAVGKV